MAHKKVIRYQTAFRPPDTSACTAELAATVTLDPFVVTMDNDVGFIAGLVTVNAGTVSTPRTTDMLVDIILVRVSPAAKSADASIVITRASSGFL